MSATSIRPLGRATFTRVGITVVEAPTLGEGWLAVSREILERGDIASYDGQATRELALLTLAVERPDSADPLIAELGDPDWLDWMHARPLDFGKKAYGNLVELARLAEHVAAELDRPVGPLVVHAKSARVYEPEWALMAELCSASSARA
jgi:hypothetical protein